MRTKPTLIPLLMSMALADPDLYRFLHQQFRPSREISDKDVWKPNYIEFISVVHIKTKGPSGKKTYFSFYIKIDGIQEQREIFTTQKETLKNAWKSFIKEYWYGKSTHDERLLIIAKDKTPITPNKYETT